jgi:Phage gp6-like head-tail connector protein
MSLDTLANVKTRLGVSGSTDDSLLSLQMDTADAWIQVYTGRDFAGGTFTEYFPGNAEFLHLANFPVTSVTSVKVDPSYAFGADTIISSSSYAVHSERGVIQSKVGPFVMDSGPLVLINSAVQDWKSSPRAVQVVYATATSAVPNDVKEAYAQLVGHYYKHVKTQVAANFQNVDRQTFGDVTVAYRLDLLLKLPLPPDIERLLAPYRTPNI